MTRGLLAVQAGGKRRISGGVHPADRKELSAQERIEPLPVPEQLLIALGQHIGAPAQPLVKPKQQLEAGQKIAEATGMVSSAAHAPVAGTAGILMTVTLPTGRRSQAIPINPAEPGKVDDALCQALYGGPWDLAAIELLEPARIVEAVKEAGIVGMGGAAFPAHVKLLLNPKRPIDTLVCNGCECEPYLTADYRLMLEAPEAIVAGVLAARKASGAMRAIIAIEDNKPAAIETMRRAIAGLRDVEVVVVETRYPMGGERTLIPTVAGRAVPVGGLPLDVGVVVVNVGTATAIAAAVLRGRPLTHRIVTVTGGGIARPANLLVPIGATFADLIEHCGGLKPDARRVIAGGPMMGYAVASLNTPVTKGTSGITALTQAELDDRERTNCVKCGRCLEVCPLNLAPTRIVQAVKAGNLQLAEQLHIAACVECGCCTYSCPARVPLVQYIRVGKAGIRRQAARTNNQK